MVSFPRQPEAGVQTRYDAFEFTAFMDAYMKEHPEVAADQKRGWDIYWNPPQLEQEKIHHVQVSKTQ
jgi:hypothetical protein